VDAQFLRFDLQGDNLFPCHSPVASGPRAEAQEQLLEAAEVVGVYDLLEPFKGFGELIHG
jgi:hypothetical protein